MYIIELEGEPRLRGQIYGETLRNEIHLLLGIFKEKVALAAGLDPQCVVGDWLSKTRYLPSIERWTPQLLEEVRGISQGAGVILDEILAWQFLDELGWYLEHQRNQPKIGPPIGQCSTVGVYGEEKGTAILAQNWDSLDILGEYLTLLHIKDPATRLETFVVTSAGRIGPFGMNNTLTGICLNGLTEYVNSSHEGLPVVFAGRGALDQGSAENAAKFIQKINHATGQTYSIAGVENIWIYEASANQVRHVPHTGTRILHTNHPLVNDDLRISIRTPEVQEFNWRKTTTRYACIQKRLADHSKPVTVETIKSILGSHDSPDIPVCRHPGKEPEISTAAGMIMELSAAPALYLAQGFPCGSEFREFSFSEPYPRRLS